MGIMTKSVVRDDTRPIAASELKQDSLCVGENMQIAGIATRMMIIKVAVLPTTYNLKNQRDIRNSIS